MELRRWMSYEERLKLNELEKIRLQKIMELQILTANYWENFKYLKDLHKFLHPDDPKIIRLNKELNDLQNKINFLKDENKMG